MATSCRTCGDVLADNLHILTSNSLLLGEVVELEYEALTAFRLIEIHLSFLSEDSLSCSAFCLCSLFSGAITRTPDTAEIFPVLGRLHRRTYVKAAFNWPILPRSFLCQSCFIVNHLHVHSRFTE